MTFTNEEERILKAFVSGIKKAETEMKKKDGIVREVSISNIIKNATEE